MGIMNIEQISLSIGIDTKTVQNLFSLFIRQTAADLVAIQSAVKEKDWDTLKQTAHSIKGAALNLELEEIAAAAKEIEEKASREAEERLAEIAAKEAEMAAKEAELKRKEAEAEEREAEIREKKLEEEQKRNLEEAKDDSDDIEKRIAAYQDNLSMACPVCGSGKIGSEKTDNGKLYYDCSNENCGFVSWGKPYPFECPMCRNSFLVEFMSGGNTPGLKCPRATCSFSQNNLQAPQQESPPAASPRKKKRRLVRRVKRK